MLTLPFFAAWDHSNRNSMVIESSDASMELQGSPAMWAVRATSDPLKKVFTCRDCNRSYMRYTSLYRHQRFECGNKIPQFSCPYCPHRTKQKADLKRHIMRKHSDGESLQHSANLLP